MYIILTTVLFAFIASAIAYYSVHLVPEGQFWIIERLGKYNRVLDTGIRFIFPYIDKIVRVLDRKEFKVDIPPQNVITKDNSKIVVDAMSYAVKEDAYKVHYGIDDYDKSLNNLIMTIIRSTMGERSLSEISSDIEGIKKDIITKVNKTSLNEWGTRLTLIEFEEINPGKAMLDAMEKELIAQKEAKAKIAEAEGKQRALEIEMQSKYELQKQEAEMQREIAEMRAQTLLHEIKTIQGAMSGIEHNRILEFLTSVEYIHSMKHLSTSPNSKFVIYPADIQKSIGGLMPQSLATLNDVRLNVLNGDN